MTFVLKKSSFVPILASYVPNIESVVLKMSSNEPYRESLSDFKSGLGEVLFPKIRRKALALFLLNAKKQYYFRETVRLLGGSPGSLQRELKALTKVGILNVKKIGVQKFYKANPACPVFSELKSIVQKTYGIVDVIKDVLRVNGEGKIEIAWIYGSIATGQDTSSSDIDIFLVGSLTFREFVTLLRPLEESLRRPINPTLCSTEEFKQKIQDENNFLLTLLESEKLFVVGDENDLERLVR